MEKHFRYYLRVRYSECDAQKVVFNSRYSEYIDVSTNEFFRTLGFGEALANGSFDFQLVKQTVEWKASARYDDVLEISVHAKHLGNSSITLGAEFRIAGKEKVIAIGETVYVCVEPHSLTKVPIPADLRAALTHGAQGKVMDHAGYLQETSKQVSEKETIHK
jgi:acyl-CoA thioester hydrolase